MNSFWSDDTCPISAEMMRRRVHLEIRPSMQNRGTVRSIYLFAIFFASLLASAPGDDANTNAAGDQPFPGQVVVAINCGGDAYRGSARTSYVNYANYNSNDTTSSNNSSSGTQFLADTDFTDGTATTVSQSLLGLAAPGNDPPLYQNFRSGPCSYAIPVANGKYIVTLAYCETTPANVVGSRVFNVAIQNKPVLTNFDILTKTRLFTPIYETFNATVTDNVLNIAQTNGSAGDAVLSAIMVRTPLPVPTKIIMGEYTNYCLVNGLLLASGSNRTQEAGFPPGESGPFFPARPFWKSSVRFADAACSGYQSLGLDTTGHVWAWGANAFGEMGNGVAEPKVYYPPTQILTDINGKDFDNVKQVDGGFDFEAALKNDGTVWVWGLSGLDRPVGDCTGIIGNGDKTGQNVTRPSQVVFPQGVTIAKISAGVYQMLALDTTGAVWSWGGGVDGAINRGTKNTDPSTPTQLAGALAGLTITEIACGSGTNYAVDSNKNLYGWGTQGVRLGGPNRDPKNNWQPTPLPVPLNDYTTGDLNGHVADVAISGSTTHVLRDDGTVWGWGSGPRGEVGDGTMADWLATKPTYCYDYNALDNMVMEPVKVLSNVAKIYSNCQSGGIFAVKKDGSIWSWGFGKTCYLGNGVDSTGADISTHPDLLDVAVPAQVAPY